MLRLSSSRVTPALAAVCKVLLVAAVLLSAPSVWAQKAPQLGYVFPPAVPAGAATEVQLGGFDFTPDMQWFVHDERVRLETSGVPGDYRLTPPPYWVGPRAGVGALPIPREVPARLVIDPAAPAGLVRWQVANANGASSTAVFYVSRGQEIIERRSRDLPQRLPALPIGVSGRLSRLTEVDRYEVAPETEGPISVELMARRLGANWNGMLQVHDSAGELVADFADTQGLDGGLTFAARSGETYTIAVHDADFRGDPSYVYRLAVTPGPRVIATLPAAGQRGTSREVEFVGWGLASGQAALETIRENVAFPADPALEAHAHSLKTPFGAVEVAIPLSDGEELAQVADAATIAAPLALTNRLPPTGDQQQFSWNAEKDEFWRIDLQSRAIGGRLDVALAVLDPEGKQVAQSDDLPGTTDAGLEFRAPASGTFTCVVRSVATRSGALDEIYRLQMRRSQPDFSLTMPQQINLPLGGKTEVAIQAVRRGGFEGEIALTLEGLPAGVVPTGDWKIPAGKNDLKATLEAAADADVVAGPIRLVGAGLIGTSVEKRTAAALAAGNLCPRSPEEQRLATALLAVTMAPPFEILLIDRTRQRDTPRGTACLAEMEIVRKDGFQGEILLEMGANQARYLCGSHGVSVRVPPDATRAVYPAWMSEWLGTEFTMRMATHGVAAVPDPKGKPRYLLKAADAPITMIMEGALLKLSTPAAESVVRPGASFEIPVSLSRSAKLPLPTTVSLVVPDEISGLLQVESIVLAPGQDQGTLKVSTAADARLHGAWSFTLVAKAMQEGKWPVISQIEAPVVFAAD